MYLPESKVLGKYNETMATKIADKIDYLLDFFKKCKVNIIIDIGCADGSLLFKLKEQCPELLCIGYDIDKGSIEIASKIVEEKGLADITFISTPSELLRILDRKKPTDTIMINMSSFLHELFTYADKKDQDELFRILSDIKPDFLAIRDFYMSDEIKLKRPSIFLINAANKELRDKKLAHLPDTYVLDKWHKERQAIELSNNGLYHLLLKLRYIFKPANRESNNTEIAVSEKEFNEDYLSLTDERLTNLRTVILGQNCRTLYRRQYNTDGFKKNLSKQIRVGKISLLSLQTTKIKLIYSRNRLSLSKLDKTIDFLKRILHRIGNPLKRQQSKGNEYGK